MKIILDKSELGQGLVDDLYKVMDEVTNDLNNLVTDVEVIYEDKKLMSVYWDIDTENPRNVCRYRSPNIDLFNELGLLIPFK